MQNYSTEDWSDIEQALERAFAAAKKLYADRGFSKPYGFGKRPAIVTIDLAKAWTLPGNPYTCDQKAMNEEIIPGVQRLQKLARQYGFPVVHVTTAFDNTDPDDPNRDTGLTKTPVHCLKYSPDNPLWQIDDRIAPIDGERLIIKKCASGFQGTDLANYLTSIGVDTVLVAGVTASCCVRATIYDAKAHGFRPVAIRECVGDRIPAAVQYNLFDIEAKIGDVRSVDECAAYLKKIGNQ